MARRIRIEELPTQVDLPLDPETILPVRLDPRTSSVEYRITIRQIAEAIQKLLPPDKPIVMRELPDGSIRFEVDSLPRQYIVFEREGDHWEQQSIPLTLEDAKKYVECWKNVHPQSKYVIMMGVQL